MIPIDLEIRYYEPPDGGEAPFKRWFDKLDARTAVRVQVGLNRLARGYETSVESVGSGVFEIRIDFGPGYRVYFGREDGIVVVLAGGTKKRQQDDIDAARVRWKRHLDAKRADRRRR